MRLLHFLIDNRLRQMAFSVFAKVAKAGFRVTLKDFEIKKSFICSSLFRYYIKQIDARGRLLSTKEAQESHEAIAECDSSFLST